MMDHGNTHILNAALSYAKLGYAVFPCASGKKIPATKHGFLDAATDKTKIDEWWRRCPLANVAIRTEGLLVVDIDGAENPWLTDNSARAAELAIAPTSLTPRGGRHYFFRQPEGRQWRNTVSKIAKNVDTRANGGYILAPPSVVEGKHYRWAEDHTLRVTADQLPEPPDWLAALLDFQSRAVETQPLEVATPADAIPEGMRNAELARMAGGMRRVGMSEAAILAGIEEVNARRCSPPLARDELERIAASFARYPPYSVSVAQMAKHRSPDGAPPVPLRPLSLGELLEKHNTLRTPVIHGLLRRGETMNIIAPPKTGKSWLALSLAMSVATGGRWLDTFETVAGDVLIIDNELHPETLAHRIPQVANGLQIGIDEITDSIHIQSLRGQLRDVFSLGTCFEAIDPSGISLVVLDAFYRALPPDMDENDNGTMANIYNHLDALSDRLGCSFVLIHHATKGSQSAKAVTDVGAGAGSQSRATDTHLVLRPHEEPGAVVLDAAVRSWPPVKPIPLRWSFPVWKPASDLDPTLLKSDRPRRSKAGPKATETPKQPEWTVERFVEGFLSDQPAAKAEIRERATDVPGLSLRKVNDFLAIGERKGLIERVKLPGQGGPMGFVRCKPEAIE